MLALETVQHPEIKEILDKMRAQAVSEGEHASNASLKAGLKHFIQAVDEAKVQCEQHARRENTVTEELKLLADLIHRAKTAAEHDALLYECILKDVANALEITEEEAIKAVHDRWLWLFSQARLLRRGREQKIEKAMEELMRSLNHLESLQKRPAYDMDFAMEGSGMEKHETHSSLLDKPGYSDKSH